MLHNGVETHSSNTKFLSAKAVTYEHGDVRLKLSALQQLGLRHDFAPPVLLSHSRCFLTSTSFHIAKRPTVKPYHVAVGPISFVALYAPFHGSTGSHYCSNFDYLVILVVFQVYITNQLRRKRPVILVEQKHDFFSGRTCSLCELRISDLQH